ncbi:MAG: cell division protein FtsA [Armatimonadota bacterium]
MAGPEVLLGLDIGTTKVAAVIGGRADGVKILGAASVPCGGLRRGTVVDMTETTRSIGEAVEKAQRMAGVEVELAWVGITGQHLACLNSRGELQLARANRQITWADVDRVMALSVSAVAMPPDRQLIHAISRGFAVDSEQRVKNPVGLSANKLAVETHVVTASRNLVDNVVRCVESAGLGVAELVAEPLATADAVMSEDEQELGALLVDIGGGTTDIAVLGEGGPSYTGAVPAAGNNITRDLAIALGVTHPQAEQIKLAHGCARISDVPEEQMVSLPPGDEERSVPRRFIAEVIEARLQEIFRLIVHEVSKVGDVWPPPGGAVITGGGSLLPGLAAAAQDALGCRTRLCRPRVTSGPVHLLESPALATAVGLAYYGHRELEARRSEPPPAARLVPVFGRVIAWARQLFSS